MNGRPWTPAELDFVRRLYADASTKQLAIALRRTPSSVYEAANKMGVHKSEAYLASPCACRLRRGDNVGAACRFSKGHTPYNKGQRRPGWAPGRMAETQFKKGNHPQTWRPIGSTRFSKEGYLQRKVTDTGYAPRDWRAEHNLLWESVHGPIPAGHVVIFKDGDKARIVLENLELISRAELMNRNTIHRLPNELVDVIRLKGVLKRRIRTITERREGETHGGQEQAA